MVPADGANSKGGQKFSFKAEGYAELSYTGMKPTAFAERK